VLSKKAEPVLVQGNKVRAESQQVSVRNKTCTRYCNRNRETLIGELLGLVQLNNLG